MLDFDDLLLYWARMAERSLAGAELGARFDHVLVDEYQDTNRLQARILLALKPDGRGITVVGDDAQAIYSLSRRDGAQHPGLSAGLQPPAAVITLERNYRSLRPILQASNAVIELARERFTKNLWSGRAAPSGPSSSRCATKRTRRTASPSACWSSARRAWRCTPRQCCSARRRIQRRRSSSSSPAAAYRS